MRFPPFWTRHIELEDTERVENSGGIKASLSGRYALALFELARDNKQLESVAESLSALKAALSESEDFRNLISSPVIGREDAAKAMAALSASMGLDPLAGNFLGVLAKARRLAQLPAAIRAFETLLSQHRGESRAEVTSAHALTKTQVTALEKALKARVGRDVAVDLKVDAAILGGLVVKIGSQMIDSSIRTRLNTLAQAMRG